MPSAFPKYPGRRFRRLRQIQFNFYCLLSEQYYSEKFRKLTIRFECGKADDDNRRSNIAWGK